MIGTAVERQGIIRHGAKMITAVSEATVPKFCVVVRKAYGAGLYAMAGPGFEPDATIALPTARIAVMGPEPAINAVFFNKIQAIDDPEERAAYVAESASRVRRRTSTSFISPPRTSWMPSSNPTTCDPRSFDDWTQPPGRIVSSPTAGMGSRPYEGGRTASRSRRTELSEGSFISLRRQGRIRMVTLERPEARNAISTEVARELTDVCSAVADDEDAWVVVLTAAGDKAFCVGADLKERASFSLDDYHANRGPMKAMFEAVRAIPQPSIASIFGYALGGGFELALSCDLIVAAEGTQVGLPEARVGLLPAGGGTQLLTQEGRTEQGERADLHRRASGRGRDRPGADRRRSFPSTPCAQPRCVWRSGSLRRPRSRYEKRKHRSTHRWGSHSRRGSRSSTSRGREWWPPTIEPRGSPLSTRSGRPNGLTGEPSRRR